MTQYGDLGSMPKELPFHWYSCLVNYYLRKGAAAYPKNGSFDLVNSLVCTINKNGGQVMVKANVNKIVVENGTAIGVECNDHLITANRVIFSPGVWNIQKMIPEKYRWEIVDK